MLDVATDHRAACIRTELVTGRSAADIYRVKTEARPAALGDASVVVRVRHLVKTYRLAKGVVLRRAIGEVRAVDGISLELRQGRTLGIVGESGSGKSTTLHEILELAAPQSGSIEVLGTDVATLGTAERRSLRRDIQVVFQDPVASLDPRLPVFDLIAEPLQANGFGKNDSRAGRRAARYRRTAPRRRQSLSRRVLRRSEAAHRHRAGTGAPTQDPGTRRTGVGTRCLHSGRDHQPAARPPRAVRVVIFICFHDLSVVKHLAHQVAVMLAGTVVEQGDSEEVFGNPKHEYTRRLLGAVPQPDPARRG